MDIIAAGIDRDRSYVLNEAIDNYLGVHRWQVAHIKEGLRQADAGEPVDTLIHQVGRDDVSRLPEGSYTIVLGERYSASGQRMPILYSDEFTVTVGSSGETLVAPGGHPSEYVTLDRFLVEHQDPIIRVFNDTESEVQIEHESLHPEQWSQHNQALIRFLQDDAVTVEARKGAYCARDVAGRLNLFDHQLSADVDVSFRDANGEATGVVSHAPLIASSIEGNGGQVVDSLSEYFDTSHGKVSPTERLSSEDPAYRTAVKEWIHDAGESPLRLGTFFYDYTKIQPEILRNQEYGGDVNSHVVLLLGDKDLTVETHREVTLEKAMEKQFHMSQQDMDDRGWMFETLGIEVNGVEVTSHADWQQIHVKPTDHIVVHDIALNHRFHTDRADTLVELMVNDGALNPVAIIEPNAELMNEHLAYHGNGGDYAVDTFHQVKPGETLDEMYLQDRKSTRLNSSH